MFGSYFSVTVQVDSGIQRRCFILTNAETCDVVIPQRKEISSKQPYLFNKLDCLSSNRLYLNIWLVSLLQYYSISDNDKNSLNLHLTTAISIIHQIPTCTHSAYYYNIAVVKIFQGFILSVNLYCLMGGTGTYTCMYIPIVVYRDGLLISNEHLCVIIDFI